MGRCRKWQLRANALCSLAAQRKAGAGGSRDKNDELLVGSNQDGRGSGMSTLEGRHMFDVIEIKLD